MANSKIPTGTETRKPACPSCSRPMYAHRGRFLCTCGRVYAPDRVNLAKHLQAAEELEQIVPACAA